MENEKRTSENGMQMATHEEMSVEEIVRRFKVSERTARRHRARGTLPDADRRAAMRNGKSMTMPARSPLRGDTTYAHIHLMAARNSLRHAAQSRFIDSMDLEIASEIRRIAASISEEWSALLGDEQRIDREIL